MELIRKLFKLKNELFRNIFFEKRIKKTLDHKYTIYFDKKNNSEISKLASLYRTNKGYILDKNNTEGIDIKNCYSYSDFYSDIFSLSKNHVKKVFELGIGSVDTQQIDNMLPIGKKYKSGGSLRMWKDYFKNANIYGADIDKKCLFEEERIKTFYVDQGKKDSIFEMWKEIGETDFDIIIDDGCHRFEETITFFESSIDKMSNNGIYIIEDILASQRKPFLQYFKKSNFNYKFINFYRPDISHSNNSLLMIKK